MKRLLHRSRLPGLAMLAIAVCLAPPAPAATIDGGRLGPVAYALPNGAPVDVVILFADDPKSPQAAAVTTRLTALGDAVALVDPAGYVAALARDKGDCSWLSSDVEALNHALQRKLAFPDFRLPVLVSLGKGGELVYGLLAEAPSYSFAGGISFGFSPASTLPVTICGVGQAEEPNKGLPTVDLKLPWKVEAAAGTEEVTAAWLDEIDNAEPVKPDDSPEPDQIAALAQQMVESAIAKDPNSLEDLPLIEMPTDKPAPYVAIIYSGDGGWRDLDRSLGQILADHGVPVIGVDSLLYFWRPKRPEIVADDLRRIIDHYSKAWKTGRFVLVGFSFGADILPFAYNLLPADARARVDEVSLLALSRNTRFEISVSEYFSDLATSETRPVEPQLARIPPTLVQCFYGVDEAEDSACTTPAAAKDTVIQTEGGHHFGDDYEALAQRIMEGAAKRMK